MVTDVVGDGCGCGKAVPRSLGLSWVGVECGMCLQGLGSIEQGSPTRNPNTHLSKGSQGQGFSLSPSFYPFKYLRAICSCQGSKTLISSAGEISVPILPDQMHLEQLWSSHVAQRYKANLWTHMGKTLHSTLKHDSYSVKRWVLEIFKQDWIAVDFDHN